MAGGTLVAEAALVAVGAAESIGAEQAASSSINPIAPLNVSLRFLDVMIAPFSLTLCREALSVNVYDEYNPLSMIFLHFQANS